MLPPALSGETVFPFLRLSGEIRNQIYLNIIGPKLPRPLTIFKDGRNYSTHDPDLWPDRNFNTALFFLNRQINREFSDVLWNTLGVVWKNDCFELDMDDVARFTSMKSLQRCKLILDVHVHWKPPPRVTVDAIDVELTIFGLAQKLSRMSYLREIHLEFQERDCDYDHGYFLRYRDESLIRWSIDDLKTVFGNDLRGMKKVQLSGIHCSGCAADCASGMERPREELSESDAKEPERCIPRLTNPQWSDKARGWI
ncbi:MAG: hypothetical protein L6R40_005151 [Gallowayella cf. fulva]|nr:MAG: hypothetical protein L6R40_005151 [Xanthomendoza cf. fulva]